MGLGRSPRPGELDVIDRDVRPANDCRAPFKGLLHDHLGIAGAVIEDQVFPGSRPVTAMTGLLPRA